MRITHFFLANHLPRYRAGNSNLPWKHWTEFSAKEQLTIVNYPDGVLPPGPDFKIKKVSAMALQLLVGRYIEAIEKGDNTEGTHFSIEKWKDGVFTSII